MSIYILACTKAQTLGQTGRIKDWRSISMSNTYNLTQAYLEVLNKLDEGYSFEDLKDTLDSIEEELNIKLITQSA